MYGGPQVQYKNLNIPVQKYKYQHKNIYFSIKILISVPKNIFQSQNVISVPKYVFQSKNIYFSTKKKCSKKYKHIPSVFATRRQKGSESFKMADLNGYSKRSNHLLFLRNYKYETILAFLERFHDIRISMRTRKIS